MVVPETTDDDPISDFVDTIGADSPGIGEHLATAEIEILGRMPWSSNGTFLCSIINDAARCRAIYKPQAGERPLWDFPGGLWRREVASYELSAALGWNLIPPTVERDADLGVGSLQLFIQARFEEHYFTFAEDEDLRPQLERMCVFDLVSNNTDRKSGHVLLTEDRRCWGIDQGLSFHEEFKLRTVIWDFAGTPIPTELIQDLCRFLDEPTPTRLVELLTPAELDALRGRANAVISSGVFPSDPTGRRVPWPLV